MDNIKQTTGGKKPLDIRKKMLLYISIASIVMLGVLWGINIGFLSWFYRNSAISDTNAAINVISKNLVVQNKDKFDELIKKLAVEKLLNIVVFDAEGNEISKFMVHSNTITSDIATYEDLYEKTLENNGYSATEEITVKYNSLDYVGVQKENKQIVRKFEIKGIVASNDAGTKYVIIIEAATTPTQREVNISLKHLFIVTAIIICLSLTISYIMGKVVALPIIDLNESAKYLTSGDFEIGFRGKGYSEIIELTDTLNYAKEEVGAMEKYRKELIANVSHDLRTPLALIKGYSEVMKDFPSEANPENIQIIIDETNRLTSLVNDMLDLSRLEQGERTLNLSHFDIVDELKSLSHRHAKLIENLGYTLVLEHDDESAFVYADKIKILQVLYNLINNAITYSGPDKKVTVKERTVDDAVRIEVIDSGEGIDVEILPRIWDRYYKSEKSHKRASVGTGLGLSIVKSVMTMHPDALYGVITSKGEGSTFYIELPISNEILDAEEDKEIIVDYKLEGN